ncbi:MAG: hypothetical protein ACXW61_11675 [Gemmatirosa sp.]
MRKPALLLGLCALLPSAAMAQHTSHTSHTSPTSKSTHTATSPARSVAATLAAHKGARAVAPRVVTIKTMDYAFEAPASIPAGATTFRIVNAGKELHHVWLVKLEQGKTVGDYMAAMQATAKGEAPPPAWAIDMGGPQMGMPGALADGTVSLDAGSYVIVCHIPAADGVPHSAKGMYKALTVTANAAPAAEPTADVTMTLRDYDFVFSAPMTAGRRTVRIVNEAEQFHEAFIARLLPGKTAAQALQWVESGMKGPPPMELVGGATGLAKGRGMQFTADFTAGEYALLCFLPDAKDGKPHVAHGMIKQITVGKKTQSAARTR